MKGERSLSGTAMKLLLVEDNTGLREQMKWALSDRYEVLEADCSEACLRVFEERHPPLVCLDMGLDNEPEKGLELIDSLLGTERLTKIVVVTAHTGEDLGSRAVAKGAFDYLRKPVDIDELRVILGRAVRLFEMEPRDREPAGPTLQSSPGFEMIGECPAMQKVFQTIQKLSRTTVNVLITGESGTGKELCARAIHFHGKRSVRPFVPINCGAIPDTLLESELFGYAKGAFTGAQGDKKGLIESADGGTLFLDEIGDMPRALQVKLLRFLEDQSFQRLGDTGLYHSDVRVIAATNRDDIAGGEGDVVRNDLYYRLSEFEIHLPPLRERGDDVIVLAEEIVRRNREKFGTPKLHLSTRARDMLRRYTWPGNVRELENRLSRAAITCVNQTIEPDDLQLSAGGMGDIGLKEARELFEKEFIEKALKRSDHKVSTTARALGVSRPTLYDLMKKHGLSAGDRTGGGKKG